ncbi:MAG: ABC transporter ATP-binding protein [Rhodospirillaceae bacterium]|jgi:branched-chain amino acid transport system ATP-binding protein|nr:ABC transporter ATP-binding protein [Rhodospirillaceae bacterium]|tara:strand:- start:1226 stop:1975 length:750 start_codon:yes stop_codon:yes gene_type:complete
MVEPLLKIDQLRKSFGGVLATDNLSLVINRGEIHAVIGPNGAGKTTMVSQISGGLKSDSGRIVFDGEDITGFSAPARSLRGISRTFQITSIFEEFTAMENVSLAIQAHQGHSFKFWRSARGETSLIGPARKALETVGLDIRAQVLARNLSHGEKRQLEIAMALVSRPKMLLLDEPMAGMGAEESKRMVELLNSLKGNHTILLIEHDMDAVFALADQITVLVYGSAIVSGEPEEIRLNQEVRAAYLGEEE